MVNKCNLLWDKFVNTLQVPYKVKYMISLM